MKSDLSTKKVLYLYYIENENTVLRGGVVTPKRYVTTTQTQQTQRIYLMFNQILGKKQKTYYTLWKVLFFYYLCFYIIGGALI